MILVDSLSWLLSGVMREAKFSTDWLAPSSAILSQIWQTSRNLKAAFVVLDTHVKDKVPNWHEPSRILWGTLFRQTSRVLSVAALVRSSEAASETVACGGRIYGHCRRFNIKPTHVGWLSVQ
jgi:hypothetical protein